jgi:hypothetical protein
MKVICLYCGADVETYTGKRPKKFCNDSHKVKYYNLYKNKKRYYKTRPKRVWPEPVQKPERVSTRQLEKRIRLNPTIEDLSETVQKYNELILLLRTKKEKIPLTIRKILNRSKLYKVNKKKKPRNNKVKNDLSDEKKQIQKRISQLEKEIANPVYTNFITQKLYINIREREIQELRLKINI